MSITWAMHSRRQLRQKLRNAAAAFCEAVSGAACAGAPAGSAARLCAKATMKEFADEKVEHSCTRSDPRPSGPDPCSSSKVRVYHAVQSEVVGQPRLHSSQQVLTVVRVCRAQQNILTRSRSTSGVAFVLSPAHPQPGDAPKSTQALLRCVTAVPDGTESLVLTSSRACDSRLRTPEGSCM